VAEISTFADIAAAVSLPEPDVRRLLRHAMTYRVFAEPSKGVVAHTAASRALAENAELGHFVDFLAAEMWPSATRLVDAMQMWPRSEEPNHAGFNLAYVAKTPIFDVVGRVPARARRMADAIAYMRSGPEYGMDFVLDHFAWGSAAEGVLVQVGGGDGSMTVAVARHFPKMTCVVQDLPEIIGDAVVPEDLQVGQRLKFMAHDAFETQPVKGADVYLLRLILHEWSDKYAVRIIRMLVPALKKGARVLVSEMCLPAPGELSPYKERTSR
jgi:hypothetical protein